MARRGFNDELPAQTGRPITQAGQAGAATGPVGIEAASIVPDAGVQLRMAMLESDVYP